MHIQEGVASGPVLLAGGVLTAVGLIPGLRAVDTDNLPRVAIMSAALFVASVVHIPFAAGVSIHLMLTGLAGLLLGWAVFPALLVALFLQAVMLQHGGLTALGVNAAVMGWPALLASLLFRRPAIKPGKRAAAASFAAGALSVLLAGLLMALALLASDRAFAQAGVAIVLFHLPLMVVEGLICASCLAFLRKVSPAMLHDVAPLQGGEE